MKYQSAQKCTDYAFLFESFFIEKDRTNTNCIKYVISILTSKIDPLIITLV